MLLPASSATHGTSRPFSRGCTDVRPCLRHQSREQLQHHLRVGERRLRTSFTDRRKRRSTHCQVTKVRSHHRLCDELHWLPVQYRHIYIYIYIYIYISHALSSISVCIVQLDRTSSINVYQSRQRLHAAVCDLRSTVTSRICRQTWYAMTTVVSASLVEEPGTCSQRTLETRR